jgi:hypothetical protein
MIEGALRDQVEEGQEVSVEEQVVARNGQERVGTTNCNSKRGLLFPGGNQYQRFMNSFHKTIANNIEEFARLGIQPRDLGSHLARKGACSFASSTCCTVSPPIASICLRAC